MTCCWLLSRVAVVTSVSREGEMCDDDPLWSAGIFHLCAACGERQNNVCPCFLSLKCILLILWRSFQQGRLPEMCICLFKEDYRLQPLLLRFYREKRLERRSHREARGTFWACELDLYGAFFLSGLTLCLQLHIKMLWSYSSQFVVLSVLQPFPFTQQHTSHLINIHKCAVTCLSGLIIHFSFFSWLSKGTLHAGYVCK